MSARYLRNSAISTTLVAAGLSITAPAALAQGQPVVVYAQPENSRTERVPYGDLNLASRPGVRTLERRVSGAVQRVCLFENGIQGFGDHGYFRCASGAWKGAKSQMDRAIARAQEIALNGHSTIAAEPITITVR